MLNYIKVYHMNSNKFKRFISINSFNINIMKIPKSVLGMRIDIYSYKKNNIYYFINHKSIDAIKYKDVIKYLQKDETFDEYITKLRDYLPKYFKYLKDNIVSYRGLIDFYLKTNDLDKIEKITNKPTNILDQYDFYIKNNPVLSLEDTCFNLSFNEISLLLRDNESIYSDDYKIYLLLFVCNNYKLSITKTLIILYKCLVECDKHCYNELKQYLLDRIKKVDKYNLLSDINKNKSIKWDIKLKTGNIIYNTDKYKYEKMIFIDYLL
ncbi:hypothetical protein HERIO_1895 [Hepatospora eriocheir]|uniref:Uncharacterized protein n=1 Tax=Hepatospora eriocheir TaxID=1081669 RepID=A0A1X0Q8P4_9MICR|nr:hypothetical protein HERIO_1895 [Hepatospora eriocheir]